MKIYEWLIVRLAKWYLYGSLIPIIKCWGQTKMGEDSFLPAVVLGYLEASGWKQDVGLGGLLLWSYTLMFPSSLSVEGKEMFVAVFIQRLPLWGASRRVLLTFASTLVHHFQVRVPPALGRQQLTFVPVGEAVWATHLQFLGEVGAIWGTGAVRASIFHLADFARATVYSFTRLWKGEAKEGLNQGKLHLGRIASLQNPHLNVSLHVMLEFRITCSQFPNGIDLFGTVHCSI